MITQIASVETPAWLASVNASTIGTNPFPLKEILTDSLYYPSSGFDGYPVRFLAGNFLSFTGFGANWTDYRDPKQILARSVLQNPAGTPEYLLDCANMGDSVACWSQYDTKIAVLGTKQIGVWKRKD